MKILLVNKNPVVSKLLSFALINTIHTYEETQNLDISCNDFDVTIVDESIYSDDIYNRYINKACIILVNKNSTDNFQDIKEKTIILTKPFMPELLLDAIESFQIGTEDFFRQKSKDLNLQTAVLNKDEIDKIQQLLNDENLSESSSINIENHEKSNKYKDNVSYVFSKNSKTKEKELIEAILSMKPKKLKKFLQNSNIKLKIEIKEH